MFEKSNRMSKHPLAISLTYYAGCAATVLMLPIILTLGGAAWSFVFAAYSEEFAFINAGLVWAVPIAIFVGFTTKHYVQLYLLKQDYKINGRQLHNSTLMSLFPLMVFLVYSWTLLLSDLVGTWFDVLLGLMLLMAFTHATRWQTQQMKRAFVDSTGWSTLNTVIEFCFLLAYITPFRGIAVLLLLILHSRIPAWVINHLMNTCGKAKRKRKNDTLLTDYETDFSGDIQVANNATEINRIRNISLK